MVDFWGGDPLGHVYEKKGDTGSAAVLTQHQRPVIDDWIDFLQKERAAKAKQPKKMNLDFSVEGMVSALQNAKPAHLSELRQRYDAIGHEGSKLKMLWANGQITPEQYYEGQTAWQDAKNKWMEDAMYSGHERKHLEQQRQLILTNSEKYPEGTKTEWETNWDDPRIRPQGWYYPQQWEEIDATGMLKVKDLYKMKTVRTIQDGKTVQTLRGEVDKVTLKNIVDAAAADGRTANGQKLRRDYADYVAQGGKKDYKGYLTDRTLAVNGVPDEAYLESPIGEGAQKRFDLDLSWRDLVKQGRLRTNLPTTIVSNYSANWDQAKWEKNYPAWVKQWKTSLPSMYEGYKSRASDMAETPKDYETWKREDAPSLKDYIVLNAINKKAIASVQGKDTQAMPSAGQQAVGGIDYGGIPLSVEVARKSNNSKILSAGNMQFKPMGVEVWYNKERGKYIAYALGNARQYVDKTSSDGKTTYQAYENYTDVYVPLDMVSNLFYQSKEPWRWAFELADEMNYLGLKAAPYVDTHELYGKEDGETERIGKISKTSRSGRW